MQFRFTVKVLCGPLCPTQNVNRHIVNINESGSLHGGHSLVKYTDGRIELEL